MADKQTQGRDAAKRQESHAVRYWLGQEVTIKGWVTQVDDDGIDEAAIRIDINGQGVWLDVCSNKLVGRTGRATVRRASSPSSAAGLIAPTPAAAACRPVSAAHTSASARKSTMADNAANGQRFWLQRMQKNAVGKVYALSWHSYKTSYMRDVWAGRYRRRGDEVRYAD